MYSDKVTTSKEEKSILSTASVAVLPKASDQRKRERFHQKSNPEQYVEYNGNVYHIANFLSLQLGKTYMPTRGRLSRWMATSRSDFYDSISTSGTNSGLKLDDMAALFVPGLNLVVGKVVRITRTSVNEKDIKSIDLLPCSVYRQGHREITRLDGSSCKRF